MIKIDKKELFLEANTLHSTISLHNVAIRKIKQLIFHIMRDYFEDANVFDDEENIKDVETLIEMITDYVNEVEDVTEECLHRSEKLKQIIDKYPEEKSKCLS